MYLRPDIATAWAKTSRGLPSLPNDGGNAMKLIPTLALFLLAFGTAKCTQPQPGPPPIPTPVADAAPAPDPFAGKVFDCTGLDTTAAVPLANTCGDTGNVLACMLMYANQGADRASLACAARDIQVAAFVEIAKETAGPETAARGKALRSWLLAEKIQLRN
jgi:hypothetical protein